MQGPEQTVNPPACEGGVVHHLTKFKAVVRWREGAQTLNIGHDSCPRVRKVREFLPGANRKDTIMNNIVYIVGLIVIIAAVASYFGLR